MPAAPTGRRRKGRALQADRPNESGTGFSKLAHLLVTVKARRHINDSRSDGHRHSGRQQSLAVSLAGLAQPLPGHRPQRHSHPGLLRYQRMGCHQERRVHRQPTLGTRLPRRRFAGTAMAGSATSIYNSQCTLNAANSSMTGSGNTLTVVTALTFHPSFTCQRHIWMQAVDYHNVSTNWLVYGVWLPTQTTVNASPWYRIYDPFSSSRSEERR